MRRPDLQALAQQAGQLLWIGFEGTRLTPALSRLLRDSRPGGVILFGRNLSEDPRQIRALTDALHRALPIPPFIALDQEGGRVSRLRGIVGATPSAATLAARPDARSAIADFSTATACTLRSLGFNVNFAPVLDLSDAPTRNGIGDRAYSAEAPTVAALAGIFATAHRSAGVIPVGKHFPGLGSALADTHRALPVIRLSRKALLRQDLLPYRRLRAVLPMVMIGHACYPALQECYGEPASLSQPVVTGLLRRALGYRGLVLTDDLEMGAVDQSMDGGAQALAAFAAGNDGLMFCRSEERIRQATRTLAQAITAGDIAPRRLLDSLRRIASLKRRCLARRPPYSAGAITRARRLFERLQPAPLAGVDPTARP